MPPPHESLTPSGKILFYTALLRTWCNTSIWVKVISYTCSLHKLQLQAVSLSMVDKTKVVFNTNNEIEGWQSERHEVLNQVLPCLCWKSEAQGVQLWPHKSPFSEGPLMLVTYRQWYHWGFWAWANSTKFDEIGGVLTPKSLSFAENWLHDQGKTSFLLILTKSVETIFQSAGLVLRHVASEGAWFIAIIGDHP